MAHPDDAEFSCAGTIARWAAEDNEIVYVLLTSGDKGQRRSRDDIRNAGSHPRGGTTRGARILGAKDVVFLKYPDAYLEAEFRPAGEIVRQIRRLKPDVVICQDPTVRRLRRSTSESSGSSAAGEETLAAIFPAARDRSPSPSYSGKGLEPHRVREVYLAGAQTPDVTIDITNYIDKRRSNHFAPTPLRSAILTSSPWYGSGQTQCRRKSRQR